MLLVVSALLLFNKANDKVLMVLGSFYWWESQLPTIALTSNQDLATCWGRFWLAESVGHVGQRISKGAV